MDDLIVGRTCELTVNDTKRIGRVRSVKSTEGSDVDSLVLVDVFGVDASEVEVPMSEVRFLIPLAHNLRRPGSQVEAVFAKDGKWMSAEIKRAISPESILVIFKHNMSEREVRADMLRPIQNFRSIKEAQPTNSGKSSGHETASFAKKGQASTSTSESYRTSGGYVIPKHLAFSKDDTEQLATSKRREIKKIKYGQKQEAEESHMRASQNKWKQFVSGQPR